MNPLSDTGEIGFDYLSCFPTAARVVPCWPIQFAENGARAISLGLMVAIELATCPQPPKISCCLAIAGRLEATSKPHPVPLPVSTAQAFNDHVGLGGSSLLPAQKKVKRRPKARDCRCHDWV
jgi:hypothetical protein